MALRLWYCPRFMFSRRFTVAIRDRASGFERRITCSTGSLLAALGAVVSLPVLIGLGAAWKAKSDVQDLYVSHRTLEAENTNYRTATEVLSGQIEALQSTLTDLGARAVLDPGLARAMDRLPAIIRSQAMGGSPLTSKSESTAAKSLSALMSPEDTFGLLRTLLEGLESRLSLVRVSVDRRNALAAATPSMWPAHGWLTSLMGSRTDPITGAPDFHAGLDIAGDRGQPVYATASGVVTFASLSGNYGNLVVLDHGFGLETRYGHLHGFKVAKGDHVTRGDIVGAVGATGRATGVHLHYEVLANGRLLNPLRLLTQKPRDQ
jgi:murein DD-endopeptidase MepM/ murein hydrolase activator NlpD